MFMGRDRILYTGLDPTRWSHADALDHVSFIAVVPKPCEHVAPYFAALNTMTHILVTSRSTVPLLFAYAPQVIDKQFIAVGQATAAQLRLYGVSHIDVAEQECGEGVCQLLCAKRPHSVFYPHAAQARRLIHTCLMREEISHIAFALYDTLPCVPNPLPDLQIYREVVLTSPSTVRAFFSCYSTIPQDLLLTPIGKITQQALEVFLSSRYRAVF